MWSGGVDSTGGLYKLLKDTRDDVFVHHIHLKTGNYRWLAEKDAIEEMKPWLRKNVRDFDYSDSTFEYDLSAKDGFFGWDIMTCMYIGGIFARDRECSRIIASESEDDFVTQVPSPGWRISISQILAIIPSLKDPHMSQSFPEIWQPLTSYKKKEIWDFLPTYLKENVWCCRSPEVDTGPQFIRGGPKTSKPYIECGKCRACKSLEKCKKNVV